MDTSIFCESCGRSVAVIAARGEDAPCPSCGTILNIPATCDVFISYATPDLAWAENVAGRLAAVGVTHWLAPHQIRMGEDFLEKIVEAVGGAKVFVLILSSTSVSRPWVRREINAAVSEGRAVLPLKVEQFEVPRDFRFMLAFNQWDQISESGESSIDTLIDRVQEELLKCTASATAPAITVVEKAPAIESPLAGVNPDVSPYAGPRPFPSSMVDKFFGRFHETEALLRCIGAGRALLVYAPSGAGKSSLLNTVIAQHLENRGLEVLLGGRVAGALPEGATAASIRNIFSYSLVYSFDSTAAPQANCRLGDYLAARRRKPGTHGRMIVLDQFEEIFTHHPERFEDRSDFFADLVAAMEADPSLRVIFAIRQEFLADIEPHLAALPDELHVQQFALKRLEPPGALEALVRPAAPYATFGKGVAEEVIQQLNTIRIPGFDGVLVEKRGEYVEMVHLQIVCQRLWSNLPRGCTCIEREHIRRAAGEGKAFEEFVVNALNAFYDDTVSQVANSAVTKEHGGFSAELIRLGCMKFVTTSATRTMVAQSHGRIGRLPDWVVTQLEGSHLLRAEQRGGERWYELSHDRLAEPISRQMDRKVSVLLYASDLLDKILTRTLEERPEGLKGYFKAHPDVLHECLPFSQQPGLFADEAEFIFRASLFQTEDLEAWSGRVAEDDPAVWRSVLEDAVQSDRPPEIRRNAATLLAKPGSGLEGELIRMVLEEQDDSVRKAAARSLMKLDQPALYELIAKEMADPSRRGRARAALSSIRVVADQSGHRPAFESCCYQLRGADARAVRFRAWLLRLRDGLAAVPYLVVPATFLAASSAAIYKMIPATFGWSIAQKSPGPGVGIFAGMTAGIIWGGGIALGLTLYRVIIDRPWKRQSLFRPFGAIVTGALSGLITGTMMTLMCASVFEIDSLRAIGWVITSHKSSHQFWRELFVVTRCGWGYIITGTGLGIGMALVVNKFRASGQWRQLVEQPRGLTSFSQIRTLLRQIVRMALPHAWPMPIVMLLAGALTVYIIHPAPPPAEVHDVATVSPLKGIIGDVSSQVVGGFFSVCGMLFGVVLMRLGLQMRPRKDEL